MKGYTKQQDDDDEAEGWHVIANGHEVREGWQEVEEVGLVEAFQEVVQFTVHSLQQPRGNTNIPVRKGCRYYFGIIQVENPQLRPADGGGVSLVLAEAVDPSDGGRLNVVSKEKAMISPRPPAGLLHHHHHQSLNRVAVSRHAVPVVSLQLRQHPGTTTGLNALLYQQPSPQSPVTGLHLSLDGAQDPNLLAESIEQVGQVEVGKLSVEALQNQVQTRNDITAELQGQRRLDRAAAALKRRPVHTWIQRKGLQGKKARLFSFWKLRMVLPLGRGVSGVGGVATCSVGVVVGLQPGLHSNQVVLIYQENDVFSPENLICWEKKHIKTINEVAKPFLWQRGSWVHDSLLKYCAKPRRSPTAWLFWSPGLQGALSTRASVLGALGARRMP